MAIIASAQELEQAVLSPEQREFFDSSLRTNEGERRSSSDSGHQHWVYQRV